MQIKRTFGCRKNCSALAGKREAAAGCARWEPPSTWVPTRRSSRTSHRGTHGGADHHRSQLAVERLVQEGFLQFLQGGEFAFIEAGEALGFYREGVELFRDATLLFLIRQRKPD